MKRTVAVLAMVLALAFPVAAHAGSSGPGSSTGTCAATHERRRLEGAPVHLLVGGAEPPAAVVAALIQIWRTLSPMMRVREDSYSTLFSTR